MSSWIDLLSKEAELVVLLGAIGFGPAALLRGGATVGSRIALAPVLGLALASCATVTAAYVMPMKVGAWAVMVPLACVSLAAGLLSRRRAGVRWLTRTRGLDLLQIGVVLVVVALTMNYPLAKRDSLGPVGYSVGDAAGYVATIDSFEDHTIRDKQFGPDWDITGEYAAGYAAGFQQIGLDPVAAANNSIFGWGATESQTALMIAVILIGALGLFAAVRGFSETRTPAAMLAGVLFAGPLFYELLLEGSESALNGLALMMPFGMVGVLVLRDPCVRNLLVLGLLAAGIQTLYPPFVPVAVAWVALVLLTLGVRAVMRSRLTRQRILKVVSSVGIVVVVAVALSPVAFSRNLDYWKALATTDFIETNNKSFPKYDLPVTVIPSYVLQTREFYYLSRPTLDDRKNWVLTVLAPPAVALLGLLGAWRYRRSSAVLALFPGAALLAYLAYGQDECSYCLQRSLLVMGPSAAVLIGTGVAAVATWRGEGLPRLLRGVFNWRSGAAAGAIVAAVTVLVLAGHKSKVMAQRATNGAYALPHELRSLLPDLRDRDGVIMFEETGASAQGVFELPATYHAVNEATPNRLAINSLNNDHYALAYLGGVRLLGPRFVPDYRWVVTRLGDVRTPRTTVARSGPFALQERRDAVDVTIGGGVIADTVDRDPLGRAWLELPVLSFLIAAETQKRVWLELELDGVRVRIVSPKGGRILERSGKTVKLCIPVKGRGNVRDSRVRLAYRQGPGAPPPELFGVGVPPEAVRLKAVSASTRKLCGADEPRD